MGEMKFDKYSKTFNVFKNICYETKFDKHKLN